MKKLEKGRLKKALLHFYNYVAYEKIKFDENMSDEKIKAFIHENNDLIIGAALSEITDEERIFLYERYHSKKPFVYLSIKMHVHVNGLQRWRDKILNEISLLLDFKLSEMDIYSRNKIEVMVYVIERIICFYKHYKFEAKDFLQILRNRLNTYSKWLIIINDVLYSDYKNIDCRIMRIKILNPRITVEEIGKITGYSRTTIYHYLHLYQERIMIK